MKSDNLDIGPRLTLAFAVLIALIVGGNSLVIWQFHVARIQSDRLTGANQQLTAVLQLQVSLLSFHQQMDDLARSNDVHRLTTQAELLRGVLREQARQTRAAVASLPPETRVDPAFMPILEAIQVTLPAQLDAINELAASGDWGTVQRRLGNELKPIETQTSVLVDSIDLQARNELTQAVARMKRAADSILFMVPGTAICTFCVATFLGWSVARRIIELRLNERVTERLRIARELHDTLLQTIQASKLVAASALIGASESNRQHLALQTVSTWLERAVEEARTALNSLHSSATEGNDMAQALQQAIEDCRRQSASDICLSVTGLAREMHPAVREEVYRIAYEAIRNACAHARASRVEVELRYARDLALCVRDDGVGIEQAVVDRGKKDHFGLEGMRERAARIGGKLTFTSAPASGTEIKLVVPGTIAFQKIRPGNAFFL